MFSAIWAEVSCEANCAQFGRRLVLRSCVRKVYKFALVYCERTGDGDQISGRFRTSERGDEASNGIPNGRSDGPRSPSERIYIIFTVSPLIFILLFYHSLPNLDLRTNCLLRLRRNFERQRSNTLQFWCNLGVVEAQ